MQQHWGFRAARAVMFTAVCVLLAVLGHVVMSGQAIPWWAVVPASASIAAAAWILADRERSVPFVVVGTVVAQTELHIVFTLAQSLQPAPMHHHHDVAGTASVGMLAAHLIAALLCGLWLAYGENATFAVLRSAADRILLLLQPWSNVVTWPQLRPTPSTAPPRQHLLADAITSRGPPRGTAVA